MRRSLLVVWLPVLLLGCADASTVRARVGVLLPLSGPAQLALDRPLEAARELLDEAGGPELELVWVDTAREDVAEGAARLLADPEIVAVIGPESSVDALAIGRDFVAASRPLVSSSATSAELFHAYAGRGSVWRTVQPDVAQMRVLVQLAARDGHRRIALVSSIDEYGATFFDWFAFTTVEHGLVPTIAVRAPLIGGGCEDAVRRALDSAPDALIAVPGDDAGVACVVEAAHAHDPSVQLLLPDIGRVDALPSMASAEGILGTDPAADPEGGFDAYFEARYGEEPRAYAAPTLDALLLVGYGLERTGGEGDAALEAAMAELARADGATSPWDTDTVGDTIRAIRRGEAPALSPASGPFEYDPALLMDPTRSTYRTWRVSGGAFETLEHVTVDAASSVATTTADSTRLPDVSEIDPTGYAPAARTGVVALIVATSRGFASYRHQADALGQYQLLRAAGVPDDRIVLVIADDLADHPDNDVPGTVRNVVGGPDLRAGAEVDHRLSEVDAERLMAILRGEGDGPVIDAGPGDDVYVFLVGHGGRSGLYIGGDRAADEVGAASTLLTSQMIGAAVRDRFDRGAYRRLFIAVESCHGEVLGDHLDTPGALLMSGAARLESSLAAGFDPEVGAWVADQFAGALAELGRADPDRSLAELYQQAFLRVPGSHVTVVNHRRFGRLATVSLSDFIAP